VLECVLNISEGRDLALLDELRRAGGPVALDLHRDPDHHRSVLTLAGPSELVVDAARQVARRVVERIDLRSHTGAHPRMGALDVVPWVSLQGWPVSDGDPLGALGARDRFADWAGDELDLPCFLYGPERSLPDVRRQAWLSLSPDRGPSRKHPTAGAVAVGARPVLVAYNLWLVDDDVENARQIARELRSPWVRTLGLAVGLHAQVSCNLIAPWVVGPAAVHDAVSRRALVARAELVGLIPAAVLAAVPAHRWAELDLAEDRTIEARLAEAGLDGGSLSTDGGTGNGTPGPAR
jgi:glutamate formiminotransferase